MQLRLLFKSKNLAAALFKSLSSKRPLTLGEGWGEGLAINGTTPTFFFPFSLSCAPSPWPSPKGRGKAARRYFVGALFMVLCLFAGADAVFPQTSSFIYQGRLTDGGTAANGNYDLQFALFDSLSGGAQVGSTQTINTVAVSNGVFTVSLDFGPNSFPGANRFLEISARPTGGSFTLLTPRQQITSTPYAVRSLNAASADSVPASGGTDNSFFGGLAGEANTSGCCNSFFGLEAGGANTTGNFNSFFGHVTGGNSQMGSRNTLLGAFAFVGSGNLTNATAIGANARVDASDALVLASINGINGATANTN